MALPELGSNYSEISLPHDAPDNGVDTSSVTNPLLNPNVRYQLERFGAASEVIDKLYSPEGEFIYTTPDDLEFDSMTHAGLVHELQQRTKPVYDAVDKRLQEDKPENGFNKHNLENHIINVATRADDLVRMGGGTERMRMLTTLTSYGHDLGNINRRREHAPDSTVIYPHILPSLTRNEHDMNIVLEAIRCHDERVISQELSQFSTSEERILHILEKGEEFGEELPTVLAALVLADKADIDRNRINEAAINNDAVERDPHVWTNLCARNEGLTFDRSSGDLIFRVAFDPRLNEGEELERFRPVSRDRSNHEGSRIHNPEHVHQAYKNGIPVFYQWAAQLKDIYAQRFALMAEMSQIALPARRFKLDLVDRLTVEDKRSADGSSSRVEYFDAELISQTFDYQHLDSQLKNYGTVHHPDGKEVFRKNGGNIYSL